MSERRLIGVIAYSFGLRLPAENEPGPCNIRVGNATKRICRELEQQGYEPVVVTQWEVARWLDEIGQEYMLSVGLNDDGTYLDSEGIWQAAKDIFEVSGIDEVVIVANPFLHLTKCKGMSRKDGFTVKNMHVGWIGFDEESSQWWTRGPARLVAYAVLQQFAGVRGHGGKQ
jgi:hypothetical protein